MWTDLAYHRQALNDDLSKVVQRKFLGVAAATYKL